MIHTRNLTTTLQLRDDGDGRTIHGALLPWGTEARVWDFTERRTVTETFHRGALAGTHPARVPSRPPIPGTPALCPLA